LGHQNTPSTYYYLMFNSYAFDKVRKEKLELTMQKEKEKRALFK
jgi:hypothetical protein